jgi:hypothetical protein
MTSEFSSGAFFSCALREAAQRRIPTAKNRRTLLLFRAKFFNEKIARVFVLMLFSRD